MTILPDALVFGIGNDGRHDDGLGWAFLDRLPALAGFRGRMEYRYQLQVEDAVLVAGADQVVFVDAYRGILPGGFRWRSCEPCADFQFSTHALPPRAILSVCQDLYSQPPPAVLLMIQGEAWDMKTGLSPAAERHLERALHDCQSRLSPREGHAEGRSVALPR